MPATLSPPETMTYAEMEARYPNHWLLIADPVPLPDGTESGTLVFASEDRQEVWDEAAKLDAKNIAVLCTSPLDPDMMFAL